MFLMLWMRKMNKFQLFKISLSAILFLSFNFSYAYDIQKNKHYTLMDKKVEQAPDVIEFFSFYCPPCAAFSVHYGVDKKIKEKIPKRSGFIKYHVNAIGPLGQELTEAWSIAHVLGIQDAIEEKLFDAIQGKKTINNANDIKKIFIDVGVSEKEYDAALNSISVRAYTAKQIEFAKRFNVISTPSFYIKGKYRVLNQGITSEAPGEYAAEFSKVVMELLEK